MGQKSNPIGLRLGYLKGWEANWFEKDKDFSKKLLEDIRIRKYIELRNPSRRFKISKVYIQRASKRTTITIHTSTPGLVIGTNGQEIEKVRVELKKLTNKDIQINIAEVKIPELDAKLVGESIAQQLESRISFKRAMKQAISNSIRAGARGIKIKVSGRLAGADMARSVTDKEGRIPLHTLRADIDYAFTEANTIYGKIGVKVWIFKRELYQRPNLYEFGDTKQQQRPRKRKGGIRKKSNQTK